MNPEDSRRKEKRRARNDPQNRNYICGCGKSYLSYPALYTHQKSKHGQAKPPGTKTPAVNGKGQRGRPKKVDNNNPIREDFKEDSSDGESSELSDDGLDEFLYFLNCFARDARSRSEARQRQGDQNNSRQERNFSLLLDVGDEEGKVSACFPIEMFQNEQYYQPLLKEVRELEQNPDLLKKGDFDEKDIKNASIDRIFATFLLKVGKHLKPQYLKEIILFVSIYRKALYDIAVQEQNEQNLKLNFDSLNAEFIIEKSNDFILKTLPELLRDFDLANCLLLGSTQQRINNATLLTQHFGNWLYSCHFTDSKLEINYTELETNPNQN